MISGLRQRIGERAALVGVTLTSTETEQLAQYYQLLERWNKKINLTGLPLPGYPDATLDRIIIEPIVDKDVIRNISAVWFDLGSGGGSPAIPMKILAPSASLTMVESRSRKSAFLREAIRQLGLGSSSVWTGRIEDLALSVEPGSVQLVTVRAVKVAGDLLKTAAALLAARGHLAIFGTKVPPDLGGYPFAHDSSTRLPSPGSAVHWFVRRDEDPHKAQPF